MTNDIWNTTASCNVELFNKVIYNQLINSLFENTVNIFLGYYH